MPVINPFGVIAGTLSAGTTRLTLGEAIFSNSNGVSFGIDGQTITASVAAGGGNTGSISAGTTRATLGEVVFSNSNGLTFGVNGQTVTGSYTVPSVAGLLSNINVSAGTTSNNLSALTFNNGNGVSFGLNGSVVTGSIATSLTAINISAGTTSNNLSAVTFANSNGITFGLDANTITASHNGLTIQSNQTVGLYAVGNTTGQSSSSTFDARTISLVGQGIASVGYSNGSVNISVVQTVQTQGFNNTLGMSNLGNTSGTSGVVTGTGIQYLFAGGPNITLSQSINGQSATLTISGGAGGAGNTGSISAGTTRLTLGEAVFANSNGVSFGVNGQTVTASIATSLTNVNISAGTTSNLLSAITFANGGNVSFGLNAGTLTASVNSSLTAINISAGTTSNNLSAITFNNANGISFGLNASTITASYTVPTVTNSSWTVSDAASSATVARLAFTNLNGITLSLSTGAAGSHTIVGSHNGITSQTNQTLGLYAVGNTTGQSSSSTFDARTISFVGQGIASVGFSAGSVNISVPAGGGAGMNAGMSDLGNTSGTTGLVSNQIVFVGGNNITLSQSVNGQSATLTISGAAGGGGGGFSLISYQNFDKIMTANVSNMTQTDLTQRPIFVPFQLMGSLTHNMMQIEVSRATSGSNAFTMQAAIYTFVNRTQISRLASLQNVFSNTDTGSISGIRRIMLTGFEAAGTTLSPGQYVMMLYASAAATASMNYSYRGGVTVAPDVGVIGAGSNVVTTATSAMSNGGYRIFAGVWSTTTASPPASIGLSHVSQHTKGLPIYFYMAST